MRQLRTRDAESLLAFVADAQSVDGSEPFTTELLDRLASVMESGFATYAEYNPIDHKAYAYVPCSNEKRYQPSSRDDWGKEITPLGDLRMWSDHIDRPSRLRFETASWAGEFGVIDCLYRVFRLGPFDFASLVLHRQDRDFTERDRRMLIALSPHVSALICNSRASRRLADLIEAVDADEHDRRGFLLLGRGKAIEHASPAGRRMIGEWFDGPAGRLPLPLEDWLGSASSGEALRVDGHGKRLVVEAPTKSALVLTEEPAALSALTAREANVLRALAAGKSTKEIARNLWVTPATVSKHLEHIYRKLGVTSRTAALAAVGIGQP
jgi:DNA-binding CsgD family transcriptional regulator